MTGPMDAANEVHDDGRGAAFWVGMGLGAAIALFGAIGLLGGEGNGLGSFIPFFAGGALLVDLVVVPLAAGIGYLGRRLLPRTAWLAVRAALVASVTLVAFAAPLVLDLGGRPDNASLRPRDYGSGLASALAVVWVVAAVVLAVALASGRRRRSNEGVDPATR